MICLIPYFILHFLSIIQSPAPKYWIEFRDKGINRKLFVPGNPIFESARASLSQKCLDRRSEAMHKKEIECISIEDAPICKRYLDSLRTLGVKPEVQSKWSDAVSARLNVQQIKRLSKLRFVRGISPVGTAKLLSSAPPVPANHIPSPLIQHSSSFPPHPPSIDQSDSGCGYNQIIYHYGGSQSQLDRVNVWPLHAMGFDGSGVLLGLLDDGMAWKTTSCIEHCNVISEYDYILHDSIVWEQPGDSVGQDAHGTTTLGTAMGYLPDTLIGPAFNVEVMLAETEVAVSERNIEEDNYAAALEDMEARGVDITSSSLGYFLFDPGQHSYTFEDMNGHTAICTQAVERAAKLGVLVVTAMGNSGADSTHPHEQAPADADSILACGALAPDGTIAGFSSLGPTADGRIKPDICAPGVQMWIQSVDGTFAGNAQGTSYATPITSGSCCLIKQAHPEATAQQIRHAVMVTGANAANPDTVYGWGELNAYAAALELGTIVHPMQIWTDSALHVCAGIASKNQIENVYLTYFGDSDISPRYAQFRLAADSLVYSCTVGSGLAFLAQLGRRMYYRITALDGSGTSTVNPSSGWNMLVLPALSSVPIAADPSSQIDVYPNPCSSQFELSLSAPGEWQLVDANGHKVMDGSADGPSEEQITTSRLANGAYYIQFFGSSGVSKVVPVIVAH